MAMSAGHGAFTLGVGLNVNIIKGLLLGAYSLRGEHASYTSTLDLGQDRHSPAQLQCRLVGGDGEWR